jgi:5-methylthioadenosine/S-adenosylhomocysteine deaminase
VEKVLAASETLPAARETLDARGHLVIPGLVNAHGHVPMILMRGLADDLPLLDWLNKVIFPAEARFVDGEFVYWGTLLACLEMARSGTTAFADMYYFEDEIARATDKAGLRAVIGQTVIGFPARDYKTTEAALAGTEAFVKRWKDHARIVPSVAPPPSSRRPVSSARTCSSTTRSRRPTTTSVSSPAAASRSRTTPRAT